MSHTTVPAIFIVLALALLLVPSALMVFFGWRKTRAIGNPVKKLAIRSFIGSLAFTPSVYGHAGPVLAWWSLIFGTWMERLWWSLVPIVTVWFVCFGIGYILIRIRRSRLTPGQAT